jgi:hypothetical protein
VSELVEQRHEGVDVLLQPDRVHIDQAADLGRRESVPDMQDGGEHNGGRRPLGLPSWTDKLVAEVVRLLLEAYCEPTFSDASHGFRPGRGCHTALRKIADTWQGTAWFIEGDIADCFGSLDHEVLLDALGCIGVEILLIAPQAPRTNA